MYDILYVIGDSYTTPNYCVDVEDSYWHKFGKLIQASEIINHSHPGKCNPNMIRNTLRFCLENTDKKIFILIGLTTMYRLDYQDYNFKNEQNVQNGNLAELYIHNYDIKNDKNSDRTFINRWTYEHAFANLLTSTISLSGLFESRKIDYLIHNCSTPLKRDIFLPLLSTFCNELDTIPKIPNLYDNTYYSTNKDKKIKPVDYDEYGYHGHHGAEGNEVYFHYLKSVYENIYLT
jgi:hypothetical protein